MTAILIYLELLIITLLISHNHKYKIAVYTGTHGFKPGFKPGSKQNDCY